jgi:hemoglobin-like flavoprotein
MNIHQSIKRILDSKEVLGDLFYSVFLNRYPEIQQYFEGVNMKRQAVLLTTALVLVEQNYSSSYPAIEQYLRYLGSKHHDRFIPFKIYEQWREAMLETLAQFHGSQWSEELAAQWRDAIDQTTELMLEGYEQHISI